MAQADYVIANAPGAVVRGDINDNLQAIVTLNSGTGAPADLFPYMFWVDTASGKIRQRNAANTAWIEIGDIDVAHWNLIQRLKESGGTTLVAGSIPDGYPVVRVGSNLIGQGVRRIRESGGADLPMGAVPDGYFLKRVGSQIVGIETAGITAVNFQSYEKDLFGDGSDGDVTISTNTTLAAGTGGVKVMRYNNLTVNAGVYLEGNSVDKALVILVKTKLTLNGTIRMNGRGAIGGAVVPYNTHGKGGKAGAFGGGAAGSCSTYMGGGGAGDGQDGQDGDGSPAGGGGGDNLPINKGGHSRGLGGTKVTNSPGGIGLNFFDTLKTPLPFELARYLLGSGGGSAPSENVAYPPEGPGGTGGGMIWVEAKEIEWGGSGLVSCNGTAGADCDAAASGGGGGGGGGFAQVAYKTKTGTPTIQATAGAGGISGGGRNGGAGATGLTGEFEVK